jgi:hypothetical protein
MDNDILEAEELTRKRSRNARRKRLIAFLKMILSGAVNSKRFPVQRVFEPNSPRREYISPDDRSTYNYGYMETDEMFAGTPYIGRS